MTVTRPKKNRARRRVHTTLGDHRPRPPRYRAEDPPDAPDPTDRTKPRTAAAKAKPRPKAKPKPKVTGPPDTVENPRRRPARSRRDTI